MRRNNKALYEKIMRNVSREVKRALNESMYDVLTPEEKTILKVFDRYNLDHIYIQYEHSKLNNRCRVSEIIKKGNTVEILDDLGEPINVKKLSDNAKDMLIWNLANSLEYEDIDTDENVKDVVLSIYNAK